MIRSISSTLFRPVSSIENRRTKNPQCFQGKGFRPPVFRPFGPLDEIKYMKSLNFISSIGRPPKGGDFPLDEIPLGGPSDLMGMGRREPLVSPIKKVERDECDL